MYFVQGALGILRFAICMALTSRIAQETLSVAKLYESNGVNKRRRKESSVSV